MFQLTGRGSGNFEVAICDLKRMRAFARLRELAASHKDVLRRLDEMERKYDARFKVVFDAIRALMEPPAKPWRRIRYCPITHFGYILSGQGGQ
jgi:hypothetical protein